MAGFISDYWANKLLGFSFGNVAITNPTTLYCALFNVIPGRNGTGGTEPVGNGYARVAIVNNTTNFPTPTIMQSANAIVITFGTPTGSGWGVLAGGGLYDAPTRGHLPRGGPLPA